jgi:uncharacterized protein (TIGR03435 family)
MLDRTMLKQRSGRKPRWGFVCAGLATAAIAIWAQAPPAPKPEFEVASVKKAPPITPALIQSGQMHIGMNIDGARVDIGGMPMVQLLPQAFNVKPYQIAGGATSTIADALTGDRWDILAKLPTGATKEQVPDMLVRLLEDRFKMTYHHEKKELQVYALIVGKNGWKLKDTSSDVDAPVPDGPGALAVNGPNGQQIRISPQAGPGGGPGGGRGGGPGGLGGGGSAMISSPQFGNMKMAMGENGNLHLESSKMTMPGLADLLTGLVDHPVLDMTEMKGTYQVTLEMSMESVLAAVRAQGLGGFGGPGGPGGGGALGANVTVPVPTASDPGGSAIFDAVQKLGMKLESRKAPVDTIVIDHIEKTPTEN